VAVTKSTSVSKNIRERSAGLVITTAGKTKTEAPTFLLVHQRHGRHWGFPKGRIEAGETEEDAALREAREETGLAKICLVRGFRAITTYTFMRDQATVSKEVVYFLGCVDGRDIVLSSEHTAWCWLPYEAAHAQLTYEDTRKILSEARDYLSGQVVE